MTTDPAVRPARAGDAPEVVRLAELMYRALGLEHGDDDWAAWRAAAAGAVRRRLGRDVCVLVAEDPAHPGRLVACGAGVEVRRMPNPGHADERVGYVQWMSTEAAFRRRGLGTAVVAGLLAWFEARGIDNVELHASPDGEPLYRAAGFWEGRGGLALRRRPWDPPPGP